jgi:hypothetical protein
MYQQLELYRQQLNEYINRQMIDGVKTDNMLTETRQENN